MIRWDKWVIIFGTVLCIEDWEPTRHTVETV